MAVVQFTAPPTLAPIPAPVQCEHLRLGMMQLSPMGLSEPWLLRHLGDRHWDLIAQALGQADTVFRDARGRAVYAAFCATELCFERPGEAVLGAQIEIQSTLHDVARHRIGSVHRISGAHGILGQVSMISCFLSHDDSGSNRRLLRNALPGLEQLPPAPRALAMFHQRARLRSRQARTSDRRGRDLMQYTPVPALDFNAVGLLYFPTFSRIAELAQPATTPLHRREVVYLGNLDPGDTVAVDHTGDGLALRCDDRLLALVQSEYHPSA